MPVPDKATEIKAGIVAIVATVTAVIGYVGWAVIVWIACVLLDYLTGSWAAMKTGTWSSKIAREGLWHKGGEVIAVLVAALCDVALGTIVRGTGVNLPFEYTVAVLPLTVLWYIFTELGSIIENAAQLGAPIPRWLRSIIASAKKTADSALPAEEEKPPSENEERKT